MSMWTRRQVTAFAALTVILAAMTGPAVAQTMSSHDVVIEGMVTGVFPETKSFFVTLAGGREVMVIAPANATGTTADGMTNGLGDLRLFDRVTVRGKVIDSNNVTADSIIIVPALDASQQLDH